MSEPPPALLPIFRSDHQLKLIGHLFVHDGKAISIAELARQTGVPQQTASREIERLIQAGLIVSQMSGRSKLVEANADSPYFPELRGLLLKAAGPAEVLRRQLGAIRGVEEAYIFGSWARRYGGEPGSSPGDIDVLVVGDADPDDVDAACRSVQRRLHLEVNPVVLSRREWASEGSGFIRQVKKGPKISLTKPTS